MARRKIRVYVVTDGMARLSHYLDPEGAALATERINLFRTNTPKAYAIEVAAEASPRVEFRPVASYQVFVDGNPASLSHAYNEGLIKIIAPTEGGNNAARACAAAVPLSHRERLGAYIGKPRGPAHAIAADTLEKFDASQLFAGVTLNEEDLAAHRKPEGRAARARKNAPPAGAAEMFERLVREGMGPDSTRSPRKPKGRK